MAQYIESRMEAFMRTRFLQKMTSYEVEAYLDRNDIIFVPLGVVENHGDFYQLHWMLRHCRIPCGNQRRFYRGLSGQPGSGAGDEFKFIRFCCDVSNDPGSMDRLLLRESVSGYFHGKSGCAFADSRLGKTWVWHHNTKSNCVFAIFDLCGY